MRMPLKCVRLHGFGLRPFPINAFSFYSPTCRIVSSSGPRIAPLTGLILTNAFRLAAMYLLPSSDQLPGDRVCARTSYGLSTPSTLNVILMNTRPESASCLKRFAVSMDILAQEITNLPSSCLSCAPLASFRPRQYHSHSVPAFLGHPNKRRHEQTNSATARDTKGSILLSRALLLILRGLHPSFPYGSVGRPSEATDRNVPWRSNTVKPRNGVLMPVTTCSRGLAGAGRLSPQTRPTGSETDHLC